jgi:hypothetical protein
VDLLDDAKEGGVIGVFSEKRFPADGAVESKRLPTP